MYAPQGQPVAAPLSVRLIGVLDADLVEQFGTLVRDLARTANAPMVVDVRDLQVLGEHEIDDLVRAVATARRAGGDVRLDARGLHWRRAAKKFLPAVPAIGDGLRSAVRRTVILAHSTRRKGGAGGTTFAQ